MQTNIKLIKVVTFISLTTLTGCSYNPAASTASLSQSDRQRVDEFQERLSVSQNILAIPLVEYER
jgi:hypothetical protein